MEIGRQKGVTREVLMMVVKATEVLTLRDRTVPRDLVGWHPTAVLSGGPGWCKVQHRVWMDVDLDVEF